MKARHLLLTLLLCCAFITNAQKQFNNWYFGFYNALSFNSGSPVVLPNSVMFANEGSASISDTAGNLLFYTNGITVWGSNHIMLPNGNFLASDAYATQAALFLPLPGSSTIYYLFTIHTWELSSPHLRYSIIDRSLNNGFGAVTASKNVLLNDNAREQLTAVPHANGTDFWIVTHQGFNNNFCAYKLSAAGFDTMVVSSIGMGYYGDNRFGQLRFSHDCSKLVATLGAADPNEPHDVVQLFDFNTSTGEVSNPVTLATNVDITGAYAAEFSPDNSKLYVTSYNTPKIDQFDMHAANIAASRTNIATPTGNKCALQLGPDGKIYVGMTNTQYLGVINNPDSLGLNCDFQPDVIDLGVNKFVKLGLPNNYNLVCCSALPQPEAIAGSATVCEGDTVIYIIPPVGDAESYTWTLPQGWSGTSITNTINVVAGNAGGVIEVVAHGRCGYTALQTLPVIIGGPSAPGVITSSGSVTVCLGDTVIYSVRTGRGTDFNWTVPTGATILAGQGTNAITVLYDGNFVSPGIISVVKENDCGSSVSSSVTVTMGSVTAPCSITGPCSELCCATGIIYSVPAAAGMNYNWTIPAGATIVSGQGTNSIIVDFPCTSLSGYITVTANNNCGVSAVRKLHVKTAPATPSPISGNNVVCPNTTGNAFSIAAVPSATDYIWAGPAGSHITANGISSVNNVLTTPSTSVTVDFAALTASSKLTVKASNNCCNGSARTLALVQGNCRIDGMSAEETFSVYPNPAQSTIKISFVVNDDVNYIIHVSDITGREMLSVSNTATAGVNTEELNVTELPKGIYIVQFEAGTERFSKKLIVE